MFQNLKVDPALWISKRPITYVNISAPAMVISSRYKSKVSSDCGYRNGHGTLSLAVIHRKILKGKSNMALIYPKSYVECTECFYG